VIYYFDTSALVKLYHPEAGSERVRALYDSARKQLVISNLSIPETFSTFHRKRREVLISKKGTSVILRRFFSDITTRFTVTPLDQEHILLSLKLIERQGLRTLDALHLASAQLFRPLKITFVCADSELLNAAREEGLIILNPEENSYARSLGKLRNIHTRIITDLVEEMPLRVVELMFRADLRGDLFQGVVFVHRLDEQFHNILACLDISMGILHSY